MIWIGILIGIIIGFIIACFIIVDNILLIIWKDGSTLPEQAKIDGILIKMPQLNDRIWDEFPQK